MNHPKPIIRTTDPETGQPNPTAHAMEPTPGYLQAMTQLLAIIDRAYNAFWLQDKTPGIFEAKALFKDLMTAYARVVGAGDELGSRVRGPVTPPTPLEDPDAKPIPGMPHQPEDS